MIKNDSVVVTGLSVISCLGIGLQENWERMLRSESGIKRISAFDPDPYPTQIAGQIPDNFAAQFTNIFSARLRKHTALFTQLALYTTHEAFQHAGLNMEQEDPRRVGICIGTGGAGLSYWEQCHEERGDDAEAMAVIKFMANAASSMISLQYGIQGHTLTISNSCSSGAFALAAAWDMIKTGRADVVIAGGTEAILSKSAVISFGKLQALSCRNQEPEKASRPFDKNRDGFVLADGAAILVLESLQHCRQRCGSPLAVLCGYGSNSEAHHIVHPHEGGAMMAEAMRQSLDCSRIAPKEIDYINAHGTSTVLNDVSETQAIKSVFGDRAYDIPVSSQKSMIGHTIGASGAIEAALTVMMIDRKVILPTINQEKPDPDCDLDYVPNQPRERQIRVALSNSFGFGGINCSLVFGSFTG